MKYGPLLTMMVFWALFVVLTIMFFIPNMMPGMSMISWPIYSIISGGIWIAFFVTILIVTLRMKTG